MAELAELSTAELVRELANRQQPKTPAQSHHEQQLAALNEQVEAQENHLEKLRAQAVGQRGSSNALLRWQRERRKLQELQQERDDLAEILAPEPPAPEPMPAELRERLRVAREVARKAKEKGRRATKQDLLKVQKANRELRKIELEASGYDQSEIE